MNCYFSLAITLCLFTIFGCGDTSQATEATAQQPEDSVRLRIVDATGYRDGGSAGVMTRIERAAGEEPEALAFSLDKGINSETHGQLFVGGMHPHDEGARLITEDDHDLLRLLLEADTEHLNGTQKFHVDRFLDVVRDELGE